MDTTSILLLIALVLMGFFLWRTRRALKQQTVAATATTPNQPGRIRRMGAWPRKRFNARTHHPVEAVRDFGMARALGLLVVLAMFGFLVFSNIQLNRAVDSLDETVAELNKDNAALQAQLTAAEAERTTAEAQAQQVADSDSSDETEDTEESSNDSQATSADDESSDEEWVRFEEVHNYWQHPDIRGTRYVAPPLCDPTSDNPEECQRVLLKRAAHSPLDMCQAAMAYRVAGPANPAKITDFCETYQQRLADDPEFWESEHQQLVRRVKNQRSVEFDRLSGTRSSIYVDNGLPVFFVRQMDPTRDIALRVVLEDGTKVVYLIMCGGQWTVTQIINPPTPMPPPPPTPVIPPEPEPEPENIQVCAFATDRVITIREDNFDSSKHSRNLNHPQCRNEPEPETTQVCRKVNGQFVVITVREDRVRDSDLPPNSPKCDEEPEKALISVCELATGKIIGIEEEEFDEGLHSMRLSDCKVTEEPPCPNCPPPPGDRGKKCKDKVGEADGFCGTPNSGPEQQPVGDNKAEHVARTPGHGGRGTTETVVNRQRRDRDRIDSGQVDSHEPTQSGVEVPNSQNGGEAPAGDAVTPAPTAPNNPTHDATQPPSPATDAGTGNVDNNSPGNDSVSGPGSNPGEPGATTTT